MKLIIRIIRAFLNWYHRREMKRIDARFRIHGQPASVYAALMNERMALDRVMITIRMGLDALLAKNDSEVPEMPRTGRKGSRK